MLTFIQCEIVNNTSIKLFPQCCFVDQSIIILIGHVFIFRFVKASVLADFKKSKQGIVGVDLYNTEYHVDSDSFYPSWGSKQVAIKEHLLGTSQYKQFLKEAKSAYIECACYIKKKMPLQDDILQAATFFDPRNRLTADFNSLEVIMKRFPDLVQEQEIDALYGEYLKYQQLEDSDIIVHDRIDTQWVYIGSIKDSATEALTFPVLHRVAKLVLLLPHSNAFCEGIFSIIRKLLREGRSNLGLNVKEGHSGSSVYSDITGTRNTLCGLLAAKVNMFKHIKCTEWEPSLDTIRQAKSVTYKTLSARQAMMKKD